ncbi:MAG: amidohydrolase family protein [Armatimonadota bacterium]|nr:amidohydrolase family protein [Armatimonadota bacterium]MDR7423194.1 amidohydrolase family protein [Armatimonadota bacterium]MDR7453167.1 amidohydrolase family protein [Armatimonadota bacterium]MDR7510918.1 amidohydrolase family protein [Armatimonadota bacterium]
MDDETRAVVDLLITGGTVLTMDAQHHIFSPGAIAVQGGRITAVGPAAVVEARFAGRERIDAPGHAVLPGLVDAYSHAGHGLIKAIHTPRIGWPTNAVYFHATTPEWWEAEAELSALERVRFGVTTGLTVVGATPARADDAAYADAHIRGVLRVGIREMTSIGPPDPFIDHFPRPWTATDWRSGRAVRRSFTHEQCMEVTADVIRRWHRTHDDRIRVCLHPPYLLGRFAKHPRFPYEYGPEDEPVMVRHAEEMRAFADRWRVLIHTHAFRGSLAWGRRAMGDRLWEVLASDVLLAHANGFTADEVEIAARSGCAVVCVPITDENVHYGICPVVDLLAAGVRVAIATDGSAPNMNLNLWKDVHRVMLLQRLDKRDPAVLPVGKALRMVTIDAARAIGWDTEIGSLEVGKQADIITVDLEQPHLVPRKHIPQLLAYYVEGGDVANVVVGGRILMRDRRILTVDARAVITRAEAEAEAAFARFDVSDYLVLPRGFWESTVYPAEAAG